MRWTIVFLALAVAGIGVSNLRADLTLRDLFPASDANQVCVDTPLRLSFDRVPTLGTGGRIQVFNAATGQRVDLIDLAAPRPMRQIGNTPYNYLPVMVVENTAHVQLQPGVLTANTTYYVHVDRGVFSDPTGIPWSGVSDTGWRFSTKAGPPPGAASVTVAADGTGDFASIQGAFDYVPVNNTRPVTIQVRNGTYREMLLLRNRPFVTLRGEDRRQTIMAYPNNANLNAGNARAMVGIDSNDFTLENLTLRNLTPAGGSQAESLRTNSQRCYVRNVDFFSYQDTLFLNGRAYFTNCTIEGDVDFIWGGGAAFFNRCEIRALRRGYNVQSRSALGQRGFVFVECALTAAAGVTGHVLARTDTTTFPDCEVAYIVCTIGSHITPAGWLITGTGGTANLRFLEYRSRDAAGVPLDVSQRAAGSRQITDVEAAELRMPVNVLGGWNPPASTDTSSPGGAVTSSPAGSSSRLVNISVNSFAGRDEQTLIAGFSLNGSGTKPVLVRGLGPSLGAFGVTDPLINPQLELFNHRGELIAANDDWAGEGAVANVAGAVGAFALSSESRDAALVATVGFGTFTAQVRGIDNSVGRAQVEIYDAAPGQVTLGLANFSARTALAPDDTLIAGFVLSGTDQRAVLIRAVGPGLAVVGLGGALVDPRLELHGASGKLFENNDWTDEIAAPSRVGAFTIPSRGRDAALLVLLAPGAYTVHVRGRETDATGLVLLEIYDVP